MPKTTRPLYVAIGLIAGLAVLATGCSTTPAGPEQGAAPIEDRNPQAVARPSDGIKTITAGPVDLRKLPPELSDPKNILSKRSVYFDYDKFEIRDDYKSLLAAHAKFLSGRRDLKMLIQGNADERGSREYNLALGQKRADAVKRALMLLGAGEDQIESVSLGEEKPKADGHDEAAWAENRRGDMLYGGEY